MLYEYTHDTEPIGQYGRVICLYQLHGGSRVSTNGIIEVQINAIMRNHFIYKYKAEI